MGNCCPSLPLKLLSPDKVRPNEQTTRYIAADGCRFVECSLYVFLVIIEVFVLILRAVRGRKLTCIRQVHRPCQAFSLRAMRLLNDFDKPSRPRVAWVGVEFAGRDPPQFRDGWPKITYRSSSCNYVDNLLPSIAFHNRETTSRTVSMSA
jgi:hypothetical protein